MGGGEVQVQRMLLSGLTLREYLNGFATRDNYINTRFSRGQFSAVVFSDLSRCVKNKKTRARTGCRHAAPRGGAARAARHRHTRQSHEVAIKTQKVGRYGVVPGILHR